MNKLIVLIVWIGVVHGTSLPTCEYKIPLTNSREYFASMKYNAALLFKSSSSSNSVERYLNFCRNSNKMPLNDMTHFLLVPLIHAANTNNKEALLAFDRLFNDKTFVESVFSNTSYTKLDRLHALYLFSEYLRYRYSTATIVGRKSLDLSYRNIKEEVLRMWTSEDGRVWKTERCIFRGKRSRIAFLLDKDQVKQKQKYFNAFVDLDLFTLAVGSSLASYELQRDGVVSQELGEVSYYFIRVLKKGASFVEGDRWLFQPGALSNLPGYDYAGHTKVFPNMKPKYVKDISWDASHFSRMPGFLNTLTSLFPEQSETGNFLKRLREGLAEQLMTQVVVRPQSEAEVYRFNNYMDGRNGIYRYNYSKSLPNGYGPFTNGTHVFWGWWKLLDSENVSKLYMNMSSRPDLYLRGTMNSQRKIGPLIEGVYKEIVALQ